MWTLWYLKCHLVAARKEEKILSLIQIVDAKNEDLGSATLPEASNPGFVIGQWGQSQINKAGCCFQNI